MLERAMQPRRPETTTVRSANAKVSRQRIARRNTAKGGELVGKKGNRERSIYKRRSDGRWCGAITLAGGKRKTFYGVTRAEVSAKLTSALRSQHDGIPMYDDRQTLGDFLSRWLRDVAAPTVRQSTFRAYESKIRVHVRPNIGQIPLVKLTPQHLQSFFTERHKSGLSARSVHHLRAILRAALSDAVKWDLVRRNVAGLVDPPRVETTEVRALTSDHAAALLGAVRGNRLEA